MLFSDLSWSIRGTLGRKYLALAQQYDDVINFTLGDPDIPTPEGICEAAIRCIRDHRTRYTASAGIPQLREAIAEDVYGVTGGVNLKAENVAITPGLSFGDAFDGYIRLAFTLEEDVIREGTGRIRHFMENLD